MRHLYENFRKKFLRKILKRLMWRAAYCTHPQAWEKGYVRDQRSERECIQTYNSYSSKASIWLLLKFMYIFICYINILMRAANWKRYWSRSRFNTTMKCDTLVNMSKAFNSVLVDARSKPIVTMLEDIRLCMIRDGQVIGWR